MYTISPCNKMLHVAHLWCILEIGGFDECNRESGRLRELLWEREWSDGIEASLQLSALAGAALYPLQFFWLGLGSRV